MMESRKPYQYTHLKHNQLIAESTSENVAIVHFVVRARQTTDLNRFKSRQTMGNSADFCFDLGNSYFIRNMSKRSQDSITNNRIKKYLIDNGIDQRTLRHRTSYRLDTADD